MGEYAVIARRKGDTWFLSGVTNWTGRTIQIPLTFLRTGDFQVTLFTDGKNASRIGDDYVCEIQMMHAGERIAITMAAGGGFALTLKPK